MQWLQEDANSEAQKTHEPRGFSPQAYNTLQ
jgi:hypothetical protein